MNEQLKPNEPFDAEEEKLAYEEYIKAEKIVIYKNEEIPVDYKNIPDYNKTQDNNKEK